MASRKSLSAIVMLGDVMLGRLVDEALSVMPDKSTIWTDTLPLLRNGGMTEQHDPNAQLNTCNLECAVTDHPKPAPKTFNFKLSPRNIEALESACIRFVSLANNHSLDYFEQGLLDSREALQKHGIAFAGVGTAHEATAPVVVDHGGTKVVFLGYSDHYEEWKATDIYRGINFIDPGNYDREKLAAEIQYAASLGDLLIVFIHWGPNWRWIPSKDIQKLAHDFIDLGATAVFGHSAHHVQGIEIFKGKPIIYGAGGFIDDYAMDESYRNDLGFLYCMHLDPENSAPRELELVPTKIVHKWRKEVGAHPPYFSYVHQAVGKDGEWLWRTITRQSAEFGTKVVDGHRGFIIKLGSQ